MNNKCNPENSINAEDIITHLEEISQALDDLRIHHDKNIDKMSAAHDANMKEIEKQIGALGNCIKILSVAHNDHVNGEGHLIKFEGE